MVSRDVFESAVLRLPDDFAHININYRAAVRRPNRIVHKPFIFNQLHFGINIQPIQSAIY